LGDFQIIVKLLIKCKGVVLNLEHRLEQIGKYVSLGNTKHFQKINESISTLPTHIYNSAKINQ